MGDNCKCGGELRWCDVCIGWKCEVCDTIAEDYGDDDEDDDYGLRLPVPHRSSPMTDQDAFLRAIVEYPFDILSRLVFADWLDENDDGANGFAERAEFIRLQCDAVRDDRERSLLINDSTRWVPAGWTVITSPKWRPDEAGMTLPAVRYRNGFVQEISCSLNWWIGGECEHTAEWVEDDEEQDRLFAEAQAACRRCHGTGRTPANGPAVVSRHPVTRVEVTDLEPTESNPHLADLHGSRYWYWPYHGQLPDEIMASDHITRITSPQIPSREVRRFASPEAAVEALSRVLVDWAREQAGLTSIPWEVRQ